MHASEAEDTFLNYLTEWIVVLFSLGVAASG